MTPSNFDNVLNLINDNAFWIAATIIVVVSVGFSCVKSMVVNRTRERTRREIAAYVAEGSMTPEQGERLMSAGPVED